MQQQVGMDERDSRGRGVPSRLIRGREKGVGTGCSGDRKVGRVKKKSAEERRIGDIGDGGDGGRRRKPTNASQSCVS